MSNFLTANAVLAGLSAETIRRLSSTWEGLPSRVHKVFIQLSSVLSPAQKYLEYRKALQARQSPTLPLLPCHLADLGWILSQHSVTLDSGHINFTFMSLISGIIQEMSQFQKTEFALQSVDALQLYLKSMFKDGADEVTRIKMSYALEADKERRVKQDMSSVSQALKSSGFF